MLDPSIVPLWPIAAALGLCLGSFLNVVIVRLPEMLLRDWRSEARELLDLPSPQPPRRFDLATPASHCPACGIVIAWHDNLPLLGWIKRRGRCAGCLTRISLHYPLVELLACALTLVAMARYGPGWEGLSVLSACLALLALAAIDLRTRLLPDLLTLPLLWAGLAHRLVFQPDRLPEAVIGAMAGYLALWGFHWLFRLATGREGMGYGDFKLFAALGAWLGWELLPATLLLAAGLGALTGLLMRAARPRLRGAPMAFGPYLALAGWIALLAGEPLMAVHRALLLP